jgi:hypothetical protein
LEQDFLQQPVGQDLWQATTEKKRLEQKKSLLLHPTQINGQTTNREAVRHNNRLNNVYW